MRSTLHIDSWRRSVVLEPRYRFTIRLRNFSLFAFDTADARIGRPLTPSSVAGVARRVHRRAYYRGAGYGYGHYNYRHAVGYGYRDYSYSGYGYGGSAYGGYGYADNSYGGFGSYGYSD